MLRFLTPSLCTLALALASCGPAAPEVQETFTDLPSQQALTTSRIKYVFVIAMENHASTQIYGSTSAPYINGTLIPTYASASNYQDNLASSVPSEPHYIWMEAGTNAFSDYTFSSDSAPSSSNSTTSTAHLVTQIRNATNGVSWMSYQEDINSTTGTCPIAANGFYAPKHDPFVFFRDVSGSTPSKTNSYCSSHHKPYTSLAADLTNKTVATYNFITPNLCHDMHGATGCPDSDLVHAGDTWLSTNLPPLISFANANNGVIFLVWDEPETSGTMPFLVIGPQVKANYSNPTVLTHSSLVKSLEQILNLPTLSSVSSANDFSGFFNAGQYP
jgi:phosphatidylinositol-3-phosphatase